VVTDLPLPLLLVAYEKFRAYILALEKEIDLFFFHISKFPETE
jgi:hypothetical protein